MNNDLISRSALLERTKLVYVEYIDDYDMDENCDDVKIVLAKTVIEAPAVDAVEVVRCRDCVHYKFGFCMRIILYSKDPNGFCESGERRAIHDE